MVFMDFTEPLNVITDSQYVKGVVSHIETADFILDDTDLALLFIQLQNIIRDRIHPLYITHIRAHTGLLGPLLQGNDEIDWLLIGNVLEAMEFHEKHHVNSKGLKKNFSHHLAGGKGNCKELSHLLFLQPIIFTCWK